MIGRETGAASACAYERYADAFARLATRECSVVQLVTVKANVDSGVTILRL